MVESENRALEFALLLTLPAALALFLGAEPIMRVLFERGAFTAVDTKATASMLAALALGLPAYVVVKVLHPSFFAREDTKTPMLYAGISLAANVILSLMLFLLIGATELRSRPRLRAGSMSRCLRGSLRAAKASRSTTPSAAVIFRILAACAAMGAVVFVLVRTAAGASHRKRARRPGGFAPCRTA